MIFFTPGGVLYRGCLKKSWLRNTQININSSEHYSPKKWIGLRCPFYTSVVFFINSEEHI